MSSALSQSRSKGRGFVPTLFPGDVFGEECLLTGCQGQIATALTPVGVLGLSRSELAAMLRRDPQLALRLLKKLASRLDRSEEAVRDFIVEGAERRLARLLLRFLPRRAGSGWVHSGSARAMPSFSRTIATTRTAHFMRKFQQLGWLSRRRSHSEADRSQCYAESRWGIRK